MWDTLSMGGLTQPHCSCACVGWFFPTQSLRLRNLGLGIPGVLNSDLISALPLFVPNQIKQLILSMKQGPKCHADSKYGHDS